MAKEHEALTWIDILDKSLPVLTAIVGTLVGLIPWFFTRGQRKKQVKYDLVDQLQLLTQLQQDHT